MLFPGLAQRRLSGMSGSRAAQAAPLSIRYLTAPSKTRRLEPKANEPGQALIEFRAQGPRHANVLTLINRRFRPSWGAGPGRPHRGVPRFKV
jgi:hypothetical protein